MADSSDAPAAHRLRVHVVFGAADLFAVDHAPEQHLLVDIAQVDLGEEGGRSDCNWVADDSKAGLHSKLARQQACMLTLYCTLPL